MFRYGVWWQKDDSEKKIKLFWTQEKFADLLEQELKRGVSVRTALEVLQHKISKGLRRHP